MVGKNEAVNMGQAKAKRTKVKSSYGNGLHLTLADLQVCIQLQWPQRGVCMTPLAPTSTPDWMH